MQTVPVAMSRALDLVWKPWLGSKHVQETIPAQVRNDKGSITLFAKLHSCTTELTVNLQILHPHLPHPSRPPDHSNCLTVSRRNCLQLLRCMVRSVPRVQGWRYAVEKMPCHRVRSWRGEDYGRTVYHGLPPLVV